MAERIYVSNERGELEPLVEKRFDSEDALQALLADHPELLDGEQMRPGDARRWILITREQGIADREGAASRWALDHLIIDQDARPTLVEVKRGANSEVRRTVVGQMLDYAAHAPRVWNVDELRETFENSVDDPDAALAELLQDDEPDVGHFWESVSANLDAKRLRLLFVADAIPDELASVVEFLNEQMPNIEVLAVEVKRFKGETTQTFVPRVIGRLAKSRAGSDRELTEAQRLYREFWSEFRPALEEAYPHWQILSSPKGKASWIVLDAGKESASDAHYSFDCPRGGKGGGARVNFWTGRELMERVFDGLLERKGEIEGAFGEPLLWDEREGRKRRAIYIRYPDDSVAIQDRERWPEVRAWAIQRLGSLRNAIQPHLDSL